jgi:hypothetical protein
VREDQHGVSDSIDRQSRHPARTAFLDRTTVQLLQHRGRRLPVYAPEFEKAAIEPGSEEVTQVGVEWLQARLTAQVSEQILAQYLCRR